jgi:hypothetical protein
MSPVLEALPLGLISMVMLHQVCMVRRGQPSSNISNNLAGPAPGIANEICKDLSRLILRPQQTAAAVRCLRAEVPSDIGRHVIT